MIRNFARDSKSITIEIKCKIRQITITNYFIARAIRRCRIIKLLVPVSNITAFPTLNVCSALEFFNPKEFKVHAQRLAGIFEVVIKGQVAIPDFEKS